ncbi:hypothetical protein [Streptomyces sp. NPDC059874]|uniref:hypothetical protein n=1 Tax=Streptomyces sp. NPDC059874 TaxID=3346983 RepID=UPI00365CC558
MHIAFAGAAGPTGIRLAAELLGRGHHLTLLTTTDVRQARLLLARQLTLIGLYPEYVDLLAVRLDARRAADALASRSTARFDAVWCVEPAAEVVAALLPLAAGGGRRTAFHVVTGGDGGPAGRAVAAAAVRDGFPAGVHCLAPTVSDLADHPELPRPPFTRIAVAEATRPTPAGAGGAGEGLAGAPAAVNLLPLTATARALADAGEQADWSGLRRIGWVHSRPTPAAVLAEAVGPGPAARLLRRLSALQPTAPTTAITLPPVAAGYLTRAAAPALPSLRSAAQA